MPALRAIPRHRGVPKYALFRGIRNALGSNFFTKPSVDDVLRVHQNLWVSPGGETAVDKTDMGGVSFCFRYLFLTEEALFDNRLT